MNRPAIVTEEALSAPVVSPDLPAGARATTSGPAYAVIGGLSFSHFLNDTMQSLIPSVYPILKASYALDFSQIGLITLAFQFTTSLLQPVVGVVTDRRPQPYSLAIGMFFTFAGLIMLSVASQFAIILLAAATVGFGSAVFHPESSRIVRLASGGRYGFAQAVFQVGGNIGTAVGPLLAAAIIVPFGQPSIAWFSSIAFVAIVVLWNIGRWYKPRIVSKKDAIAQIPAGMPASRKIIVGLVVLALLSFSKALYTVSLSSYYTFYLMEKFGVSTQAAQIYLFVFLAANAAGVFFGGPIGDRIGRKYVIWLSILGALPFALAMPHLGLIGGTMAAAAAGFIISSATAAIIVFAQELMPHRVGMISGIFFGFSFGVGGLGAAALGKVADIRGIEFVFAVCSFLPAMGLIGFLLPNIPKPAKA
ncbi:MFS transporter [Bradyrhizobium sp. LHD-71]|uniref:MFS transporter n=1 Tax=Bradyrhizobium sp. LHD-71 TaxID=3072141 RepID=UPI00280C625A|nr:MFS transporter [Bradyrhizobium sp. LHD-71]MDQ8726822.1 MFS transporter [Bradyrhizobium sp. LHD-71]